MEVDEDEEFGEGAVEADAGPAVVDDGWIGGKMILDLDAEIELLMGLLLDVFRIEDDEMDRIDFLLEADY